MKKLVLIALPLLLIMVAVGYFAEPYLFRPPEDKLAQAEDVTPAKPKEMLFKMPLGKFTLQVVENKRILHMLMDLDVYIAGNANFEKMNGAMGRAQFRDTTISEIAEMAETAMWVREENINDLDRRFLAEQIVRRLYQTYPSVRTARINQFVATVNVRE